MKKSRRKSSLTFRTCISALSSISMSLGRENPDRIEKLLTELGYARWEAQHVWVEGALASDKPELFLKLLVKAFDFIAVYANCSPAIVKLSDQIYQDMMSERVVVAIARHQSAHSFLHSNILLWTIIVTGGTILMSIVAIFGVTPTSLGNASGKVMTDVSIAGFLGSLLLLILCVLKVFEEDAELGAYIAP